MTLTNLVEMMTTYPNMRHYQNSTQTGFTLIELMIVIMMIALLAVVAIPSYRTMMIRNTEAKTEAKVKQIMLELDTWRANTLSFREFAPKKVDKAGRITYEYDAKDNKTIFLPLGSNAAKADYQIVIDNGAGGSLVTDQTNASKPNITAGNRWRIFATPLNNYAGTANRYYLDSTGMRCKSKNSNLTVATVEKNNCTGTGVEKW